ncbi:hypothetical protein [Pseudonocardia sp.]|uniref:hypothetical protein n=1 Tax=Pseudonocardia sp. TaxID=60912 RepID=UPI003D0B223B
MSSRRPPLDIVLLGDIGIALAGEPDLPFVAGSWLATASVRGVGIGHARAVPTPAPFPPGHPTAAGRTLGPDRCDEWLAGGLELVELSVATGMRRCGVGASLLEAVCTPARAGRVWVALDPGRHGHVADFLAGRGWTCPADGDPVVLLGPRHPAGRRAVRA